MGRTIGVWVCIALATLAPTAANGQVASADSLVLERSMCFGTCPAYRIRVARDGSVLFHSRNPGESTEAREKVPARTLSELMAAADRIDFFSLPSRVADDRELCAVRATDHPGVTITVFGVTTKSVDYGTGCYVRSTDSTTTSGARGIARHPRLTSLTAFAKVIDSTLGTARWVRPAARR